MSSCVRSRAITHVAVSVPARSLTRDYRSKVIDFYDRYLGWSEIDWLRRDDRLTLAICDQAYLNVRELDTPMTCGEYEHIGVLLGSSDDVEATWRRIQRHDTDVHLGQLERGAGAYRAFRFQHLLPIAVEVQYLPSTWTFRR
jgi:hypothetical protein